MRTLSLLAAALAVLAAACAAPSDGDGAEDTEAAAGEDALIGGSPATVAQFPATLYLAEGCTAAKVAPKRLLTAAHCAFDASTLDLKYGPTRPVSLTREPAKGFVSRRVAAVHVHPAWLSACQEAYCATSSTTGLLDAADVAVIELAEDDLPEVPLAKIDTTPLAPRDRVTVLGFGCTEGVLTEDKRTTRTLKYAETTVVAPSRAIHAGSFVDASKLPQVSSIYAMTPGPASAAKRAGGLCPGDSGGPLYKKKGDTLVVVGVNANYTLRPEGQDLVGVPVTNWHTRLDVKSKHDIAGWLKSVGAL